MLAEFLQDVRAVPVDRLGADDQGVSDFFGGMAFGDQFHDLLLPGGEDTVGGPTTP